jgi:hypothetical protein
MKKLLNYLLKRKWWFGYPLKRRLIKTNSNRPPPPVLVEEALAITG